MIIFDDAVIDLIYIFILQKKNLFRIIRDVTKICFKLAVRLYGCNIKYERIWIGIQSRSKVFSRHIFYAFKYSFQIWISGGWRLLFRTVYAYFSSRVMRIIAVYYIIHVRCGEIRCLLLIHPYFPLPRPVCSIHL